MMEDDLPPIPDILIGPFPEEEEDDGLPEPVLPAGGVVDE